MNLDELMTGGEVSVTTTEPGWLRIPDELPPAEREAWVRTVRETLREVWGEQWRDEYAPAVDGFLERGLADREETPAQVVYQVWPVFAPVVATCRVVVLPARIDLPREDEGFVIRPHRSEGLGEGAQLADRRTERDAEGAAINLLSMQYVFVDDTYTVIISVDETLAELVTAILPGLLGVVDGTRITRPDGRPFVGVPPAGLLSDEAWDVPDEGGAR